MRPFAPQAPNTDPIPKARHNIAARLVFLCVLALCALIACGFTEYILSLRRESHIVTADSAAETRMLPPLDNHAGKININQADKEDLQRVSGIGPALSQAIVDCREERGGFYFLEEIMDVPGIGEKRFAALQELFYCPLPGQQTDEPFK